MEIILLLIILVVVYFISIYNKFMTTKNKVEEALSGIDVALAKRYATLTNLMNTVKGYIDYEREVLTAIAKLRQNPTMNERNSVDANHTKATIELLALQENYPELKANEQFLSLQDAIKDCEEHLAASRRMYNSNVSRYNDLLYSFPSNLIANMINAKKMEYFEASLEEKENVTVKL